MVRLDDTSGSDPIQDTLSGGSSDWKQEDVDTDNGLDGIGIRDSLKVVVSADTSLNGGVGSDEVVEDSYNEGDTGSDNIDSDRSRDWNGDGSGGEELEHFNHEFLVGDFVWGKIKSHPWWPGQVFDHSDASEFALNHWQEGRYLVAFFGDGSFSWCLPTQLVPFAAKEKNPMDFTSRDLFNAVQAAVDEVGRVFESTMTCNCMPLEKRDDLARRTVSNVGVKAGTTFPDVDVHRLTVPEYGPADVLAEVIYHAKSVSIDSPLELAVLRSWLSAFYYAKDGHQLPEYHEYNVEGLEDKDQTTAAAVDDFSVPIEVPILRPTEEEWLTPPVVDIAMTEEPSSDKTCHRRKQKSVADLMKESKKVKARSYKKKSTSSLKRKMKSIDGEAAESGRHVVSSRKNGKKIKVVASETPVVFSEDSSNARNCATTAGDNAKEGNSAGKPTAIVITCTENVSDKAIEESDNSSTPRERKKSKYLCPPYIFPEWRTGICSAKIESRPDKTSKTDQQGENVSENISASEQNLMVVDVPSNAKLHGDQPNELGRSSPRSGQNEEKLTFNISDVSMPVSELLTWVQIAAVTGGLCLNKEGTLDVVWAFVSALRSCIYVHGENYKIYKKYNRVRKRKSLPSRLGKQVNLSGESLGSADVSSPRVVKIEGGKSDASRSEKVHEISREGSSSVRIEALAQCLYLILSFPPGFRLPFKEEIVKLFSKFGSLNVEETSVMTDTHSAQVAYLKDSDAETALKSVVTENLFGVENVNYRLQHSPLCSKIQPSYPKSRSDDDFMSDARLISKKVDIMIAILDNYHAKFSTDDKSSLKDDMKYLMDSVETVSEKVRVMAETHRVEN